MFKAFLPALLFSAIIIEASHAEDSFLKTFKSGSYQQILQENAQTPFILAIWSVDCPSCLKDMDVLYQVSERHQDLKIVMLSTDEPDASSEAQEILKRHKLDKLENWMFGDDDAQKLRYEIDPHWYGELPRTYFFNVSHTRTGKSGALKIDEFESQITTINQ